MILDVNPPVGANFRYADVESVTTLELTLRQDELAGWGLENVYFNFAGIGPDSAFAAVMISWTDSSGQVQRFLTNCEANLVDAVADTVIEEVYNPTSE